MLGCVLPDALEFRGVISHRTVTHYPYLYAVPAALVWFALRRQPTYASYVMFFVLIGCLCHLAQDALSKGGIPLKTPWTGRWGANFYITRELSEYATAGAIMFAAGMVALLLGRFDYQYLSAELVSFVKFMSGFVDKIKSV